MIRVFEQLYRWLGVLADICRLFDDLPASPVEVEFAGDVAATPGFSWFG
jgi:hypothetical protein